jgi:opacity protein-like surface antigen
MKNPAIAVLALFVLAAAPAAHAQEGTAYYGLSIGEFDYEDDLFGVGEAFSDSVSTWHLMVGYQFLEHLAVEGAYGQSGRISDTVTFPGLLPGQQDVVSYETELDRILTIRLLGVLPFEDAGISLMAGIGYADVKQEIDLGVNGTPLASGDVSANNPAYYFGVQYDWERVALRLGYEKYDFDGDVDATEASLTFFYKL